jgi:hypothetical protein
MRCVLGTISVQVSAMWLTFQIRFHETGAETQTNRISVWFPSISNLGTLSFRLDIHVDIETGSITADMVLRPRHTPEDHVWGEEPAMV